jgi:hypothetical protein
MATLDVAQRFAKANRNRGESAPQQSLGISAESRQKANQGASAEEAG